MSTKSLHTKPGVTSRRFRVLALAASLSLATAGLVGLGLAPAASASDDDCASSVSTSSGSTGSDCCVSDVSSSSGSSSGESSSPECTYSYTAKAELDPIQICFEDQTIDIPGVESEVTVGPQSKPITQEQKDAAQADADQLAQDERADQLARYESYRPGACPTPDGPVTTAGGGGAKTYTASATSSGSFDVCLADGVSTLPVDYSVTGEGSGPTQGDADYSANVAAAEKAAAAITANTPAGASLGACGAPVDSVVPVPEVVPVPVDVPEPATVPADVPEAATVPTAVPAGDGSQAPVLPIWALALVAMGVVGAGAAGKRAMAARK